MSFLLDEALERRCVQLPLRSLQGHVATVDASRDEQRVHPGCLGPGNVVL